MMNKELLVQLLHEGTGLSIRGITMKLDVIIDAQEKIKPGATQGYYTAFSQDEAADILLLMRKRQSELISWFLLAYERATKVDACNERL